VSQVRLYLDEDSMRRSLAFGLRARNVDVLTAAEADMINRPDEDQLIAASATGQALFTYNTADYCALHQNWMSLERTHAGIIVAPQQQYSGGRRIATDHAADQPLPSRTNAKPVGVFLLVGLTLGIFRRVLVFSRSWRQKSRQAAGLTTYPTL
jgi:hypothetical protein